MVDWLAMFEALPESKGSVKIEDGQVIDLDAVEDVEERDYTFDNDGVPRTVTRYIYTSAEERLIVPISLHRKILELKHEYRGRLSRVKIKVTGAGIKTRYDAMPLI